MKIDTIHGAAGSMRVTMTLKTAQELSLTDDALARIGLNQHLLSWTESDGNAEVGDEDPQQFEKPDNWACRVLREPAMSPEDFPRAIVIYRDLDEEEDAPSGQVLQLVTRAIPIAMAAACILVLRHSLVAGLFSVIGSIAYT